MANQMESSMQNTMQNAAEQFEKANKEFMSRVEDVASFNRNNVEACMQAATIMANGVKDINQAMVNSLQATVETAMSTGKAMMGVKTLRELMQLQSEYMKSMFDAMMSESTKVSEIAVRCTSEAAEPISERVNEMVVKITDGASKRAA